MKKIILTIAFTISCSFAFSQTAEENLKNDFNSFFNLVAERNFESAFDYILDDERFSVSKENFILLEKNQPQLEIRWGNVEILHIDSIKSINDIMPKVDTIFYFTEITFRHLSKVRYMPEQKETEDARKKRTELVKKMLKKFDSYEYEEITYCETSDLFTINSIQRIRAFSDNGVDFWRFAVTQHLFVNEGHIYVFLFNAYVFEMLEEMDYETILEMLM